MKKTKSLIKKVKNLNVKAFNEGFKNHSNNVTKQKHIDRAEICSTCDKNMEEPIETLQIKDEIKSISDRYCDVCGCCLPYLVRQDLKPCPLNKWK